MRAKSETWRAAQVACALRGGVFFCVLAVLLCCARLEAVQEINADVCVYGGTSGGVIAAVQAARMGKSVALVVVNDHLGGMTSGGLGQTDIGKFGDGYIQGVAREFYTRVGQNYGTGAKFTFEPHVAEAVFNDMAGQAGVKFYTNQYLAAVLKSGQQIIAATMNNGNIFRAKMFIDASYEGDLMAAAGVSYTMGREAASQYGESLNGIRSPNTGGHQFGSLKVDPYLVAGNSSSGLLPLIHPGSAGASGGADQSVQAYNFRLCLTTAATNKAPITAPANYDPAQYELLGRYIQAMVDGGTTPTLGTFMNVSSMPNGKTDVNNNGPVSTDFIEESAPYTAADFDTRQKIWQAHRDYLQGFLYFLATDSRVPSGVRASMANYGFCKDEFADDGGWPYQLYVREARRMISDYVMVQSNCLGLLSAPDSIGLGAYAMDSHNCRRIVVNGYVQNEGDTYPLASIPGFYPIPYRAVVPKSGECTNLLVPWCLSASHMAFGSIRMEPVFMILGQSVATAACFAIDDGVGVQNVNIAKLQAQLLADNQKLQTNSVAAPTVNLAALLLDFGPTAIATLADALNDPAHAVGGLSGAQTNWNTGITNSRPAGTLVYSDGTAAAGVSLALGRSDLGDTTTIDFNNTNLSTILGSSSLNSGIYANGSPMKDGVFANGTYTTFTGTNHLGLRIDGLAAGSYTVFVAARNCNTGSGTNGQENTQIYYSQGAKSSAYTFGTSSFVTQTNYFPANTSAFAQGDNFSSFKLTLASGNSLFIAIKGVGFDSRGFLNAVCIMAAPAASSQVVSLWATDAQAARLGPQSGGLSLSRLGDTGAPLAVQLNIGGTASNGIDYPYLPNVVTIPSGAASAEIAITPYDLLPVGDKVATFCLAADPSYSMGNPTNATIVIRDNPLSEWQVKNFGLNVTNESIAGVAACPVGDGVPNLLKYALGLDPHCAVTNALLSPQIDADGAFALTYTRPDPPPLDVDYVVQTSEDLAAWNSNACTIRQITLNSNNTATVACESSIPVNAAPKQFMRLQVARNGVSIQGAKVVAFGDSITFGYGVPAGTNWVNQLQNRFALNMINAGVSGNTSSQGLARIQSDVLDPKPNFVLINFGMNDHVLTALNTPKVDAATFRNNLATMVDRIRTNNAIPILITANYLIEGDSTQYYYARHPASYYAPVGGAQAWLDSYLQIVREVAAQKQVDLVDVRAACDAYNRFDFLRSLANGANDDDGVHPYLLGSDVYFREIGNYLASHY